MILHTLLAAILLAAGAVGLRLLKRHIERNLIVPIEPPTVVLKDRPAWMSDGLAAEICRTVSPAGLHSSFDHSLLVKTVDALRANPWVREVRQVRRAFDRKPGDTIEIDCEFRAPLALVRWGEYFWLVDGQGVKLPEQFTASQVPRVVRGSDRRVNLRIIEGIKRPPPESGQLWPGEDLLAALELVKLLHGLRYAEDVVKVDASNFAGRKDPREPQLVLITKYSTQVRWGRPVAAKDFFAEVPAAQKLEAMRQIYQKYRRADANRAWVDIRFDTVTYPGAAPDQAHADVSR